LRKAYHISLSQKIHIFNISYSTLFPDPDESVKPAPASQLEVSDAFLLLIVNNAGNVLNDMSTGNFVTIISPKQLNGEMQRLLPSQMFCFSSKAEQYVLVLKHSHFRELSAYFLRLARFTVLY
jgi:hypothetical protein